MRGGEVWGRGFALMSLIWALISFALVKSRQGVLNRRIAIH